MKFNFLQRMSFKRKLIAYSLLFSVVPVVILGLISSFIITKSISEEVERSHLTALEQIKFQLNQFGANLQTASIYLASDEVLQESIDVGPSNQYISQTLQMAEMITDQRVFSPIQFEATVIYKKEDFLYSTKDKSIPYTKSIYYHIMQTVQPKYNSSFLVTPNTFQNQEELLLFRPIPIHSYYTNGILVMNVSVDVLMQFINKLNLGYGSKLFVVDDKARIVISQNKAEIGSQLTSITDLYQFWKNPVGYHGTYSLDGEDYKLSALKSSMTHWTYIVMTPMKQLTEKPNNIKQLTWLIVTVLTLLWILISFVGSRRMYFPIELLLQKFPSVSKLETTTDGLKQLDVNMMHLETTNRRLKTQLNEYLPYMKEKVYHQLFWGEMSDSEIRSKVEQLDLPLQGTWFYVCVVMVDEYTSFNKTYQGRDRSLIHYALRKMTQEIIEEMMPCITMIPQTGQVAVVIGRDKVSKGIEQEIYNLADSCRLNIKKYFHFTVSISVSQGLQHYSSINTGYYEAISLLNYRLIMGRDVTITDNKVEPAIKHSGREMNEQLKSIVLHVAKGRLSEANAQLKLMIEVIPQYTQHSETVLGLFSQMIGELGNLMYEMGFDLHEFFEMDLYKHLYSMVTLQDVEAWFVEDVFPTIKEQMDGRIVSKQQGLIQQVVLYIKENMEKDLSLQRTADQFSVSPSYLSRVFKEETDQHYSDYIIAIRIEKAKEWLEHSNMSIKEITERLCYTTVQSFSRVFKQIEGSPPGEYRKQVRE